MYQQSKTRFDRQFKSAASGKRSNSTPRESALSVEAGDMREKPCGSTLGLLKL